MLLPAALLLMAAQRPSPPSGELVLDAADPVILVQIAGIAMRLRVDLDQQDSVELNPSAAARLELRWESGMEMNVGRVRLRSRIAPAILRIGQRDVPTQVSEHGRDCCRGSDGAIGPDLLPFAAVRWRRRDTPAPTDTKTFQLDDSPMFGLSAPAEVANLRLRFALTQPVTVATAAAAAALARGSGGHWKGADERVTLAFGVSRPARRMAFTNRLQLAGFTFDQILVRISDFAGSEKLPADPGDPRDIVVAGHLDRQPAWPAVTLGTDRLSSCVEIAYAAVPGTLTLRCAFDGS